MEEQYWKQFTQTGAVTDYLGYKMEVYGHMQGMISENREVPDGVKRGTDRSNSIESDRIDRYGVVDNTCWRI